MEPITLTSILYLVAGAVAGYVVKHVQAVNAGTAKPILDPNNQHSYDELLRQLILKLAGPGTVPVVPVPVPAPANRDELLELAKALLAKPRQRSRTALP